MLKFKTTAALLVSMFIPYLLTAGEGQIRRSPHAVKGEYIVVLNDDTPRDAIPGVVNGLAHQHGGSVQRIWQDALKGYFVLMNEGQANGLSHNPKVKYVEENAEMFLSAEVPTKVNPACDPPSACPTSDNRLWHLDRIDQNGAAPSGSYAYCDDGTGVYVYVVDLGVQRAHREFNNDPNKVLDGYNAGDDGAYYPAYDPCHGRLVPYDHGTGVGSLVAGRNVGIARGAKIVPVKVANCGDTSPRSLDRSQSYAAGEIVFFNSTSYICVTAGTTGATVPPTPYPWVGDPGCANGAGLHDGTACFDYRGQHTVQTVQMVIEGVDWILRPSNTNPVAHQVATFSTYRMGTGPHADAATQFTIAGRPISFEEAVRNLINAGVTVIASANNQNANACDTSPARLSRNSPYRPDPSDPAWSSYKVITAGGTMITNNPDGPSTADGGPAVHTAEPSVDLSRPVNNARWICGAGDSDNCSAAPPTSGDPNSTNYEGQTLGSNAGQCVTLFAPAKNISVASFTGYRNTQASGGTASGTSWSAPIVAGVVARILGSHPTYTVDDVYNTLMASYVTADLQDTTAYPLNPAGITGTPNALLHIPDVTIAALPGSTNGSVTASASGTAPLTYQWYQAGSTFDAVNYHSNPPNPTAVSGATSATLSSSSMVSGTSYFVRVKSSCGSADSNITTYSVCVPAAIIAQPTASPSTVTLGSSSTLSIGVSGTVPVTVQWYTGTTLVGTGTSIVVSPPGTSGSTGYYAIVSNSCGSVQSSTVTITVRQPATITWATPAAITYGASLGATQLCATANTAGTFTYSPATGTVLAAGTRTLSLTFSPADTNQYLVTTATQSIVVNKANPGGSWPTPAPITYGTPLSATQLNGTSNIPGTTVYDPPAGTILTAGTHTLTATFTPNDTANYNTVSGTVSLTVLKAATTVTWSAPSNITYGTALGATQLNASASVAGTFTYSPAAGTVLSAGTQTLTATFTPTDTANYNAASGTVSITVVKATPTITWSTPSSITYGTALGATQLNASASVAGTFTYLPAAGTVLTVGTQTLTTSFTPTDTANYNTASGTVSLTVVKATPTIMWSTPSSITYGTAIGATQLNASATVAGTFTYSPAAGTVPGGGDSTLSVSFSPTDSANYNATSATVTQHVNRAAQTITWATPATITNATPLSATQLNATVSVVGPAPAGAITYDVSSGTVLSAGDHTITATAAATANYDSAQRSVVLHVCGLATINWQPTTARVADGNSTTLSIDVSSPTTAHYQWYYGYDGTLVGTDSATFNTGVLTNGGGPWSMIYRYWVVITNDCGQVRSSNIDVIVSTDGGMDDGG
jgi:hypothetical protein